MRHLLPAIMVLGAITLVGVTVWFDGTYAGRLKLSQAVDVQAQQNEELRVRLETIRSRVHGLASGSRVQEREVRTQLGFVRSNEQLVLFDSLDGKKP